MTKTSARKSLKEFVTKIAGNKSLSFDDINSMANEQNPRNKSLSFADIDKMHAKQNQPMKHVNPAKPSKPGMLGGIVGKLRKAAELELR